MTDTSHNSMAKGPDSPSVSTALLDTQSPVSTPGFVPPMAPFARSSRAPSVQSFYSESPYGGPGTRVSSIVDKWSLGPDPRQWGANLSSDLVEDDDDLHKPEKNLALLDRGGGLLSARGLANLGCVAVLVIGVIALFAGYPIVRHYTTKTLGTGGAFNVGGTNATGQVPLISGGHSLIDPETPDDVKTKSSWFGRGEMELVFSDEFNTDGRTFYPGDDPFWEAVDLHYWPTGNTEWYDPRMVTTSGGSLTVTLDKQPEHMLNLTGGMIQTWNKFCFTGGLVEAKVMMPSVNSLSGLWPAIWTMGNLGRAGYGATTDGLWPYSYDDCDAGTLQNQSLNGVPDNTLANDKGDGPLSFLPGQRLSRCTCKADGHLHPGPRHSDGTYVGRSAPEIDVFEQQVGLVQKNKGEVSQSLQLAPFNVKYDYESSAPPGSWGVSDTKVTKPNSYSGGVYQQAASRVSMIDQNCFERNAQCYSVYGFEYKPGFDDGYIQWISNNLPSWFVTSQTFQPDNVAQIKQRPIPMEPLYLIINLGQSPNFTPYISPDIQYPVTMFVDWIRVYQPKGQLNYGCSPPTMPTADYINEHIEAYTNPNLTLWTTAINGYNKTFPRNSLKDGC